jgi:hypothetical protein
MFKDCSCTKVLLLCVQHDASSFEEQQPTRGTGAFKRRGPHSYYRKNPRLVTKPEREVSRGTVDSVKCHEVMLYK